jgi:hypothetical protein
MRTIPTLAGLAFVLSLAPTAIADPDNRGSEVIVIHGAPPPPAKKAKPKNRRRAAVVPEYSDAAIEHNAWERAWLLLDIDATGAVTRVKFLHRPGYDLENKAIKKAFSLSFEPAHDADGNGMESYVIWPLEWPSYWWLVQREGVVTTPVPSYSFHQPCKDSGEGLNLDYIAKAYRDCSTPDLSMADTEAWIDTVPDDE